MFCEMELQMEIEFVLYFPQKEAFLMFQEMKLSSPNLKRNSYILGGKFKVPKLKKLALFFLKK